MSARSAGVAYGRRTRAADVFSPRVQVSEMQRARLLGAAVGAVEELGYTRTTVAHITSRARISRRTFYDLFANREECLLAVCEDALARINAELAAADLEDLPWRERVRGGLWRILCFFDSEPALARLCVVQTLRGGAGMLERREEILAQLAAVVDAGRGESARAMQCPPLTAEGVVGATLSILYTRLLKKRPVQLSGLLGELMSMIVLPYLGSATARRELARSLPAKPPLLRPRAAAGADTGLLAGEVQMRLTYRTARVLEAVDEYPGISNRAVADEVGINDQGQVSKLLSRLERLGLLTNDADGHVKGEPNAWHLTPAGQRLTQSVRVKGRYLQPEGA